MTIEEIKKIWADMDDSIEHQHKLNKHLIMEMTKEKYHNRIKSISDKERIGAFLCFMIVIYLLYILKDQDTWYLVVCNVISLIFYIALPILSLLSIYRLNNLKFTDSSLKTTINEFNVRKAEFLRIQQFGIIMGLCILIIFLPPVIKSVDNKDIFVDRDIWYWYLPISLALLSIFARWGYRYYRRTVEAAGNILADFEE